MSEQGRTVHSSVHKEHFLSILLVEDDVATRESIELVLTEIASYRVVAMQDAAEALQNMATIQTAHPALFLLDYKLQQMTGIDLYDQLHSMKNVEQVPALIITAYEGYHMRQELAERTIEVIRKPYDLDELLEQIQRSILSATIPDPCLSG